MDCCAKCGSTVCAGQSTDCPDPYFAHNIYIYTVTNMKPYDNLNLKTTSISC